MAGSIRPILSDTVTFLKEAGEHEKAAAVEAVTGPRGYLLLQRTEEGELSPLSLTVNAALGRALRAAAEEFELVLDGVAEEAYQLVLDGEWVPDEPWSHEAGPKSTVQVQVSKRLREQVREALPRLTGEAGFRITESNIALSHLCDELGIERSTVAKVSLESLEMRFPKSLVQHWEQAAEAAGVSLAQVVEERIPDLVAGTWTPERNPYLADRASVLKTAEARRGWSEWDRQRLWLPINKDLLASLRTRAQELSEELGYLVYPGAVVRAILTDRFGESAE